MKKYFILLLTIVLFLPYNLSQACTIIVAGKKATTDGSVLVSHSDGGLDCRLRVIPRFTYKEGEKAPVYWGIQNIDQPLDEYGEIIGYIPQVRETYSYIHSALPHINEHQLCIGESTMSQRESMKFKRGEGDQIMTVEQAEIFALQRCSTAVEAVKLIGRLVEEYGFLPSCIDESECLAIADPNEVWLFEVFSVGKWQKDGGKPGAIWAAKRVPDDHVAMVPNWSTIKHIDTTQQNCMASPNYMQHAIDEGWYNPESNVPFHWQKTYSPIAREWATSRFWLFYSTWAPNYTQYPDRSLKSVYDGQNPYIQYVEDLDLYPFSVKPEKKMSYADIMDFQRSVFEGTIYDMTSDPDWYIIGKDGKAELSPLATPFPTMPMRKLLDINWRRNVARGGFGMVAQLRSWLPDAIGGIYWVYLDNEYVAPYVPIYAGVTEINPLYKTYNPDQYSEKSARWAYDFVDNLMYLKWQNAWKDVKPVRDSLESTTAKAMVELEAEAAKLYKRNPDKAKALLTEFVWNTMEAYVEEYKKLRNLLLVKYTNNKQGINF
ncbi:MAG: C69 family dipeptidase [Salinivirgaceae bacterium]|jgi:dipeptidase|nr:C69 family dipeptidase [Salinivirgaceae bacterium]